MGLHKLPRVSLFSEVSRHAISYCVKNSYYDFTLLILPKGFYGFHEKVVSEFGILSFEVINIQKQDSV